ncbi:MAG: hypothetical protein EOP61_10640 [Sphingomonadales bacterium]|nr:MAG: hypothetical protein EOP61_10640 [Sphingomonadales bacterium]
MGALLLAGAGVPALVQGQSQSQSKSQDAPESLLPPGFDEPTTSAPAPAPAATRAADPAATTAAGGAPLSADPLGNESAAVAPEALGPIDLTRYELPEYAKHSLDKVGVVAWGNAPFPARSMGAADGRYLDALLKRLNAPVASRWVSIALRRALMSPLDTPKNINGADFAASRAWVLLRMGEANAARAVIDDVDAENYTTWLYQVAMQSSLASGDPAGMCGIADEGAKAVTQRSWALARAMCAGLAGKPSEAGQLLSQARRGTSPSDIDNLLAEKVLGSGAQGRRAVTLEWQGVNGLTAWRFGLATAMGEQVPAALYATAGPQVRYWQALSPSLPPVSRAAAAELAASAGVFSSAGLIDLYSEIAQDPEASGTPEEAVARDLRTAYIDGDVADRVTAIRKLWDQAKTPRTAYARLILTARAASWIPVSANVEAPEKLIASMLSAGMESPALEWRNAVKRGSEGWALLTLADPSEASVAYGDFDVFSDVAGRRKAQLMLAGLAGLGRLEAADARRGAAALDVPIGAANSWTKAIDAAGQRGDSALVALLAAVGMQSRSWDYVTPEALFHIVAAMKAAGMGNYARMIAVEAISRA